MNLNYDYWIFWIHLKGSLQGINQLKLVEKSFNSTHRMRLNITLCLIILWYSTQQNTMPLLILLFWWINFVLSQMSPKLNRSNNSLTSKFLFYLHLIFLVVDAINSILQIKYYILRKLKYKRQDSVTLQDVSKPNLKLNI